MSCAVMNIDNNYEAITTRSVDDFEKLDKLGEGTYGVVYRARDKKSTSGQIYALKRLIMHNERKDGFPITSLREIGILTQCRHRHCVSLKSVATSSSDSSSDSSGREGIGFTGFNNVFLVFEYCEHDLSQLLRRALEQQQQQRQPPSFDQADSSSHSSSSMNPRIGRPRYCPLFSEAQVKTVMQQLLSAVAYLHSRNIIHRDVKPSNVLYNNRGEVKLADFGLARVLETRSALNSHVDGRSSCGGEGGADVRVYNEEKEREGADERNWSCLPRRRHHILMTPVVTTLWYRAIEVLLGLQHRQQQLKAGSASYIDSDRNHSSRDSKRSTDSVCVSGAYGPAIDVWSCGCVFGELLGGQPLCPGDDDVSQAECIFALLGAPTLAQWPELEQCRMITSGAVELPLQYRGEYVRRGSSGSDSSSKSCIPALFPRLSTLGVDFLTGCLAYNPEARMTASQALQDDYFSCSPYPVGADYMPTFPSVHGECGNKRKSMSSRHGDCVADKNNMKSGLGAKLPVTRPPSSGSMQLLMSGGLDLGYGRYVKKCKVEPPVSLSSLGSGIGRSGSNSASSSRDCSRLTSGGTTAGRLGVVSSSSATTTACR